MGESPGAPTDVHSLQSHVPVRRTEERPGEAQVEAWSSSRLPVLRQKGPWESFFYTLLALPFKTSGTGPHTGKMTLLLAELGDSVLGSLNTGLSKVPVCFPHGDFQEQWPRNPREHASPNPLLYCLCAVKTSDSHLGFTQSHTQALILFQIQLDEGFLWSHLA